VDRFVAQFVTFQDIQQKKEFLVHFLGRMSEVIRSHPLWYKIITFLWYSYYLFIGCDHLSKNVSLHARYFFLSLSLSLCLSYAFPL